MANKKEEKVTEGEIVEENKSPKVHVRNSDGRMYIGVILLMLGALIFMNNFYPAVDVAKYFWPAALILLGASMVVKSF